MLYPFTDNESLNKGGVHVAGIITLTFIIALAAWHQLGRVRDSINSDFLLRMVEHYTSEDIIKAREIIHGFYIKSKKKYPDKFDNLQMESIIIRRWHFIGEEILQVEASGLEKDIRNFSYLLSLLDYLEFISYFANNGKIKEKDLNTMVGNSLNFYYDIFYPFIEQRRIIYNQPNYYLEFENLVLRKRCKDRFIKQH